jgi:hypothetical protein
MWPVSGRCSCPERVFRTKLSEAGLSSDEISRLSPDYPVVTELAPAVIPGPDAGKEDLNLGPQNPYTFFELKFGVIEERSDDMRQRLVIPERLRPVNSDALTEEEAESLYSYREAAAELSHISVPEDLLTIREKLAEQDVEIEVELHFESGGGGDWLGGSVTGQVEGTIRYQKTDDPDNAVAIRHDLQCFCEEYEESYSCIHTRFAVDQHMVLLSSGTDTKASETQIFSNFVDRYEEALTAENEIRHIMRYDSVNRVYAKQIIAERERAKQAIIVSNEQSEEENQVYRERMLERWETVEEPYSQNMARFYEDYKAVLSRRRAKNNPVPFRTENVTDGACADEPGTRSFGVELEFDVHDHNQKRLQRIGEQLYEAGLTRSSDQEPYHTASKDGWASWSFEQDGTVSGELVSPLMKDTPECWEQLRLATEIITRNGGVATTETGSHVHVSTGSYGNSTAKHAELLRTVNNNEDLMYRLSSNPRTGRHRRGRWCAPNTNDTGEEFIPSDVEESHDVLGNHQSHYVALNLAASGEEEHRKSHVEFRMWDGTLDPAVIQQQIMVSVALTDQAEREVLLNGGSRKKPTNERAVIGEGREKETQVMEKASMGTHNEETFLESNGYTAEFFDKLFRRREDRSAAVSLFAVTSWQPK